MGRGGGGDSNQVVYVDGDVPQRPLQLGQLLVDSSRISSGVTNLQQCTSQDPLTYEPLQGGYPVLPTEVGVVNTNYYYGDVRRYGASPSKADNTQEIQNAATSMGTAGTVYFPDDGVYSYASTITLPDFQTWTCPAYEFGAGGSQAGIRFTNTGSAFGLVTGASQVFNNIRFVGMASYNQTTGGTTGSSACAIRLTGDATFTNCVWRTQYKCIQTESCFYTKVYGGQVNRCGQFIDMVTADVFDLTIENVSFSFCSNITGSSDTPQRRVHNLKVTGGSLELFTAAFNCIGSATFSGGWYVENTGFDGAFGFNSDGSFTSDVAITIEGCFIFLNHLDRFVNYSGLTGGSFTSLGNVICGSIATTGPTPQIYFVPPASGGRTVMQGDKLDGRVGAFQGSYTSNDELLRNQLVVWPIGHPKAGQTWLVGGVIWKPSTLANSATPSVLGGTNFLTGGTTTITDFTNGVEGQTISILAEHTITITDGTNIFLSGSANFAMNSSDTLTLICKADGKWYELARSDNT